MVGVPVDEPFPISAGETTKMVRQP